MDQTISLDIAVTFLAATPLFQALDQAELAEVVRIMDVRGLADGENVFREGDPGDGWYVLFGGRARVLKETDAGRWEITVLERGSLFGEIAVLDGEARSATVQALGPATVFRFSRPRFEELLEQGSLGAYKLVLAMARMLSQRHRDLTQQLSELTRPAEQGLLVASAGRGPGAPGPAARYQVSE